MSKGKSRMAQMDKDFTDRERVIGMKITSQLIPEVFSFTENKIISHPVNTGRLLTIACHMNKNLTLYTVTAGKKLTTLSDG